MAASGCPYGVCQAAWGWREWQGVPSRSMALRASQRRLAGEMMAALCFFFSARLRS